MLLNNKVYDRVRWITQYFLPVSATLYFILAIIWGVPYSKQIIGVISILTMFFGVLLGVSSNAYIKVGADTDGVLQIDVSSSEKDIYRLQLNNDFNVLADKQKVSFIINRNAKLF